MFCSSCLNHLVSRSLWMATEDPKRVFLGAKSAWAWLPNLDSRPFTVGCGARVFSGGLICWKLRQVTNLASIEPTPVTNSKTILEFDSLEIVLNLRDSFAANVLSLLQITYNKQHFHNICGAWYRAYRSTRLHGSSLTKNAARVSARAFILERGWTRDEEVKTVHTSVGNVTFNLVISLIVVYYWNPTKILIYVNKILRIKVGENYSVSIRTQRFTRYTT